MAYEIGSKAKNLPAYDPICGTFSIRLDANESFITPDETLMNEIRAAVSKIAFNRYPDPYAVKLCKAFADYYGVDSSLVTAGNGSDELISVIMSAFLQQGDSVMTFSPDFSMYKFYTSITENKCLVFEKDKDFRFNVDEVCARAKSENIRLIIFSNPCNPTSVGASAEDIRRLIKGTDALVVLDEAYMDFWNQSLLNEVCDFDNLIILRTCSKAVGMAAVRLGFAVARPELTAVIRSAKSPYNVNAVSQEIGRVILGNPDFLKNALKKILASRDELYDGICKLKAKYPEKIKPIMPNTNFVFTEFEEPEKLFEYLKSRGIVVRRMGAYLRITAGTAEENAAVLKEIEIFYSSQK